MIWFHYLAKGAGSRNIYAPNIPLKRPGGMIFARYTFCRYNKQKNEQAGKPRCKISAINPLITNILSDISDWRFKYQIFQ